MGADDIEADQGAINAEGAAVAEAVATERARIAHLIHDDVMQVISAVALHLQVLESELGDEDMSGALGLLATDLRHAAARLWEVVFDHARNSR